MVNKVILVGRAGRDPESRSFQNGGGVVSFSLATTESWRDKSTGERKDRTEWHNISIFNENLGKIASQYVRKGSRLYIEGQIQTREYTDMEGAQRKAFEIVLPKFGGAIELLDDKPKDGGAPSAPRQESAPQQRGSMKDYLDDDIPFEKEWR
jgi:single-strand DNA-binding protein